MKLLINSDIYRSQSNSLGDSDEDIMDRLEYLEEASAVLTKYGVHHVLENYDSYWVITVYAQKVSLDDISMNDLFCNGFDEFDIPLNIKYSPLGGAGCEFAIQLTEIKNDPS